MFNLLLISIGITCVILSVMVFNDKINLLRNGVKIKGEVVDFEHSRNALITDEKEVLYIDIYKPIIRFKNDNGNIIRITLDSTQTDNFYRIGDRVDLIYAKGDIENIEINEIRVMMKLVFKLVFIGIVFLIFGIFFYSIGNTGVF